MMSLAVDVMLGLGLVVLAWMALGGPSLFRSIVMFLVFGLTLAIVWARLGSPDLAMAEAALGTGVTGVLLMVAYWRVRQFAPAAAEDAPPRRSALALAVAALSAALVAVIGLGAAQVIAPDGLAGVALAEALPATGLGNPITGVLVVFRNLDTLLEVAVLLGAYVAARAAMGEGVAALPPPQDARLVRALATVLVPMAVLVALYLLKAGGQSPGGAFQAGALLGSLAVVLLLMGTLRPTPHLGAWVGGALVVGTVAFSAVGLGMMAVGAPLLAIPGMWAVYLIETAMMISIGATLALLFASSAGFTPHPRR